VEFAIAAKLMFRAIEIEAGFASVCVYNSNDLAFAGYYRAHTERHH